MTTRLAFLALSSALAMSLTACGGSGADSSSTAPDVHAQLVEKQEQLDAHFEGCEWVDNSSDVVARSACATHEIGIVIGQGEGSVRSILDQTGEGVPVGGYVAEDNWGIWSTDRGVVNQAWDVTGASGERVWYGQ